MGDVVKDKFSDSDESVELKIFPGFRISSKILPKEQSKSNLNINSDYVLSMSATFTDNFRRQIRNLHNNLSWC